MSYKRTPFKMAPKSPLTKALKGNQGKLPQHLQEAIKAAPESPAKQVVSATGTQGTVGGKSLKEVNSAADVPKSTSFGGTNYNLGAQTASGPHYYNEGFSSKHEKKGTIKRPNDTGVYHISRETVKPVKLNKKKASIKSPAKQTKEEASAYMDSLREKRAKKAAKSGDKGRAQRIRSTKDSQDGVPSPVKQTKSKGVRPEPKRQMGPLDNRNPHKPGSAESKKYIKDYNTQFYDARAGKSKAGMKPTGVSKTKSPAKKYKK